MVQRSEKQSQASAGRAQYEKGRKQSVWKRKSGICKDGVGSRRSQAGEQEESWEKSCGVKLGTKKKETYRSLYEREKKTLKLQK